MRRWGTASGSCVASGTSRAGARGGLPLELHRGLPGETEDDHDQLIRFVDRRTRLVWLLRLFEEDGTYSADLDGKVDRSLVDDRLAELRERQDRITAERRDALVGAGSVLVDEPRRPHAPRGTPDRRRGGGAVRLPSRFAG